MTTSHTFTVSTSQVAATPATLTISLPLPGIPDTDGPVTGSTTVPSGASSTAFALNLSDRSIAATTTTADGGAATVATGDPSRRAVPRFTDNQFFWVRVTIAPPDGPQGGDARLAGILLPVVIVPGMVGPAGAGLPDVSHPFGGDGTFPNLEAYLAAQSTQAFQDGRVLGEGYEAYPTLSTLSSDRDRASFRDAALLLRNHITAVLHQTWAGKVNVVTHSKGGLVARYLVWNLGGAAASVNRLVMTVPPNVGALPAFADIPDVFLRRIATYPNLRPLWPWFRFVPHPVGVIAVKRGLLCRDSAAPRTPD